MQDIIQLYNILVYGEYLNIANNVIWKDVNLNIIFYNGIKDSLL